jgi:ribonuclease III
MNANLSIHLEETIGFKFQNPALLGQALTHSSYVNENPRTAPASNERLEFLGDAVLGMIIAEELYADFPACPEGELTQFRANIVRSGTLSRVAKTVDLGSYLLMGRGEETSGGREKTTNLEATLESLIGAAYLDAGYKITKELVLRLFAGEIRKATEASVCTDYKSRLQEIIQADYQKTPSYKLVDTKGPEHDRTFTVHALLENKVLGSGSGKSKKAAETEAARDAIEKLDA